jgi:hypothetical protein
LNFVLEVDIYYESLNIETISNLDETLVNQQKKHCEHQELEQEQEQIEKQQNQLVEQQLNNGEEFYMEDIYENNTSGDLFENYYETTQFINENGCYDLSKKLAIDIQGMNSETSSQSSSLGSSLTSSQRLLLPRLLSKYGKCDAFRKPCVYMLNEGRCMRADCRFAHDLHNITCKYWLEGECLKGESCEFMHDFPSDINIDELFSSQETLTSLSSSTIKSKNSSTKKDIKNQVFNLNTNDFPELGGQVKSNNTKNDDNISIVANYSSSPLSTINNNCEILASSVSSNTSTRTNTSTIASTSTSSNKKNKKFNILYSLSLPAMTNSSRKKNIN